MGSVDTDRLCDRLGIGVPIVQAGLGGGLSGGELAGAVAGAGALGTVGIFPPQSFAAALADARERAGGGAVAANLLVPFVRRAHIDAIRTHQVRIVTLFAGFNRALVEQLHTQGVTVIHQVGSRRQAGRALADGADILIAQGNEAGGHQTGREPVQALFPRVLALAGGKPVLAAGGVVDATEVRRLLDVGAAGVVAGTRFLLTPESAAHPAYKQALLQATCTLRTELFTLGWPLAHRVVPNPVVERWCAKRDDGPLTVRLANRVSALLGRLLPLDAMLLFPRLQLPWLPLYSPGPALAGMPMRVVNVTPLYAGAGVARIDQIVPAADAVATLNPVAGPATQ